MTHAIEIQNLSIGYRQKDGQKAVAQGLNATIRGAELTCLIGANGVGKSTLLRTLSAFQPRLDGDIAIDGRDIATLSDKQIARTIGIVLTSKPDVQNMTVTELVGLGRSPYTGFWGTLMPTDDAIVEQAIATTGIGHLAHRMIQTLSDGERQKVMIAKALAQQTPVIMLDEPTAFLDFPSKVETMQLLRKLSHDTGKIIFLSTHDLELALQTADQLWLMDRDEGLIVGTPRQLADSGHLSRYIERRQGIIFDRESLTIRIISD